MQNLPLITVSGRGGGGSLRDFRAKIRQNDEECTIEPVQVSDWAAPIVPVLKSNKSVCICGYLGRKLYFRFTVSPASKLDNYPIPKVEELLAKLNKGKFFMKLDLSQAYQQVLLDPSSMQYVVINTTQRPIQVYQITFWDIVCARNILTSGGKSFTRNSWGRIF